ncbi:LysM domain-containing protein [Phanerochaete sordida]|uniref:LysM domain-containing protein n=1 Tax=Phanerochaete sordida TaxID=48140 RepID=A0A9P3GCE3_9APHY|nr:LysM domain-containing protein [Phanerochaete sordida]
MFASSVVAALVALPFLAQSASAADCTRSYTIQDGDICDNISANNNVSTYQLAVTNPTIDGTCNNLQPGQTLCLGYEGQDCQTTYVVKGGDTCDQITGAHGINATMLWANNQQINADCTNIYIGEVLCVASEFGAPPAPSSLPITAIPAGATPAVPVVSTSSVVAATTSVASATPTPAAADEDDDDDLPFCDEL